MPRYNSQRRGTVHTLPYFCFVLYMVYFMSFCVLFVCKCVLYYCHWVATQLQLTNISCHVNKKVQLDATICRNLFTAKSLYMFRASQHPSSGVLKTVTATSGIGHNTGTATSSGLSRPRWKEVAVPVL